MKLICIIKDASPYAPVISVNSKTGHRRVFNWQESQRAHVWDRGELLETDSTDLEDLLGSDDKFYRPIVRIIKNQLVHRPATSSEKKKA